MLGVTLIKKYMNEEEIAKRFEDAVWHSEHQNYDLNFVGKFALSEAPRELGGEGADEVNLPFNCVAIITNHEGWASILIVSRSLAAIQHFCRIFCASQIMLGPTQILQTKNDRNN